MNRLCGLVIIAAIAAPAVLSESAATVERINLVSAPLKIQSRFRVSGSSALYAFVDRRFEFQLIADDGEARCLAQAVYFEARSEPLEGQLAVAQVVLNRVQDRRYPSTVCEVVFQNEHRRHRCQFSFACDGRSDTPYDKRAWDIAQRLGYIASTGQWQDLSGRATHYHADYVRPYWNAKMQRTAEYGRHSFYRDAGL